MSLNEAFPVIFHAVRRNHRFPMPASGQFFTACGTAIFCQMLLNGSTLNGRRYLSEAAFDGFPGEGGQAQGLFKNWAIERFGIRM